MMDDKVFMRVLLCSLYATITGRGVRLRFQGKGFRFRVGGA